MGTLNLLDALTNIESQSALLVITTDKVYRIKNGYTVTGNR